MGLLVWFNFVTISTKVKYFPVKTRFTHIYIHLPGETTFSFHVISDVKDLICSTCLDISTAVVKGGKGTSGG